MDTQHPLTPHEKRAMSEVVLAGVATMGPARRPGRRTVLGGIGLVLAGALAGGAVSAAAFTLPIAGDPSQQQPAPPVDEVSAIVAFERPATDADALPATLPGYATESLRQDTSRFVGVVDSVRFYVVQGEERPFCVLVYPEAAPDTWVIGCGDGMPVTVRNSTGVSATLHHRGQAPSGKTPLDPNISVNVP